jgi:hypothetical protein
MAINKDNFIVIYKLEDYNSADFAAYYALKHNMSTTSVNPSSSSGSIGGIDWEVNGQLVGIKITDNSEILSSESVFNTQILNPILDAISNSEDLGNYNIWGIILGYGMTGGFYSGDDIISATSRLSRMNFSFSKKKANKLYNRSIFKRFDTDDASISLICSRIDAPNVQAAKTYIDNAERLNNQLFANGTFYIDQYSDRYAYGYDDYQEILSDFNDNILPTLNLDTWATTYQDPYIDAIIPFVENDSFVWSWFTDRSTSSFFQFSNSLRVFFYNADYDGGFTIRDENSKRWPYLALNAGYVCTAGAMSNPTIHGFLNPISFFNALLRGATIGEAFLFSVPHVDWTISLFGDPLVYCSFPSAEPVDEDLIGEHITWENMSKDLAKIAANLYKKEAELKDVVVEIVNIDTLDPSSGASDAAVTLLYPSNDLYLNNNEVMWKSQLKPLIDTFFDFPRLRYYRQTTESIAPNINTYLTDNGFKVSRLLSSITSSAIIEEDNLLDEGWWQFEFIVDDDSDDYVNYHFILEVSNVSDFSNILITKDSYSIRNWTYEKEKNTFVNMSFNGVSSSYVGRKVRYESRQDSLISLDEYLTRGETYYFRVTQYNLETEEQYASREYSEIIYT